MKTVFISNDQLELFSLLFYLVLFCTFVCLMMTWLVHGTILFKKCSRQYRCLTWFTPLFLLQVTVGVLNLLGCIYLFVFLSFFRFSLSSFSIYRTRSLSLSLSLSVAPSFSFFSPLALIDSCNWRHVVTSQLQTLDLQGPPMTPIWNPEFFYAKIWLDQFDIIYRDLILLFISNILWRNEWCNWRTLYWKSEAVNWAHQSHFNSMWKHGPTHCTIPNKWHSSMIRSQFEYSQSMLRAAVEQLPYQSESIVTWMKSYVPTTMIITAFVMFSSWRLHWNAKHSRKCERKNQK